MLPYPQLPGFDYTSFLHDNVGLDLQPQTQAHDASAGASSESPDRLTPSSSDNNAPAGASIGVVARRQPVERQSMERRGHTKSRRGCYNCKRRRIKVYALLDWLAT